MNKFEIPALNPVQLYELNPTAIPQYLSKQFGDYRFKEQLAQQGWNEQIEYSQKWQTSDIIKFQFQSNYSPVDVSLIDENENVIISLAANNILLNRYEPGMYVFEAQMALTGIADGCYYIKVECGSPVLKTLVSEPLSILATHENTVLLEYSNSRYHGDVIFETGIVFGFRVEGVIGINSLIPGGKRNIYEDEKLNPTVLSSKPFRTFSLSIGGSHGVPDWVVDKLMWIWSCNSVLVDGISYQMIDETFDFKSEENYPMRGVNIKVREGINRGSKILLASGNSNIKLIVGLNVETRLFGNTVLGGSNNVINIKSVE